MKEISECRTVYELLESPERWHKGNYTNVADTLHTGINSPEATCFCILGAIRKVYKLTRDSNEYAAILKASLELAHYEYLHEWNDAPERTHAEVLEAVRKAGI
jgi:hypothetical protein